MCVVSAAILSCAADRTPRRVGAAPIPRATQDAAPETTDGREPNDAGSDTDANVASIATDPCKGDDTYMVFAGEFVGADDDLETGYASFFRYYRFKPVLAWKGVASENEVSVWTAFEKMPPPRLEYRKGEQVLVFTRRQGLMPTPIPNRGVIAFAAGTRRARDARKQIAALGEPCWRAGPRS